MLSMLDAGHDLPLCRAVAGKLIGDHDTGRPHLPLQQLAQQPLGCLLVAPALNQDVERRRSGPRLAKANALPRQF
jgi:hypothetical protein